MWKILLRINKNLAYAILHFMFAGFLFGAGVDGKSFALSTLTAKLFFTRNDGIALVYGTVMRNLSIALAIAINAFGEAGANAALVIALAYIIQVQSAAWYVQFTDRLFGVAAK